MSLEVLTELLGLAEVSVVGYELPDAERLILDIEIRRPAATCPTCGEVSTAVHSCGKRRTVRDLDVWGRQCYLRYVPRQFTCRQCQDTFVERLPWLGPHRHQTQRFAEQVYQLVGRTNVTEAALHYRLSTDRVASIFERLAHQQVLARGYPRVRVLNVDEIAAHKGQGNYRLVLSSPEVGVLEVLADRHKATFEAWLAARGPEWCAAVEEFHADMWRPYHEVARDYFPNVPTTTADHFHVIKNLTKALSEIRKAIQRQADAATREMLKGSRWLLLKNPEQLSATEHEHLATLLESVPEVAHNYHLKEDFRALYALRDPQAAAQQLEHWLAKAKAVGHAKLQSFITTVENWQAEILSFFTSRGSNAFAEGVNNKIKLVLRRAFGCPNFTHFRLRIMVAFSP